MNILLTKLVLVISIAANITFFVLSYYTRVINQFYFFNSDSLYIPSLYKDLFYGNGSFWDWFLTPAPYFFPDMLLYIAASVFHDDDSYNAIVTFGILQLCFTFLVSYLIFRIFFDTTLSLIFCAFSSILLIPLVIQSFGVFKYAGFSAFHYGATLSSLLCILMLFYFLDLFCNQNKKARKIKKISFFFLYSTVIGISIASDKLFLLIFCAPILTYWLYKLILILRHLSIKIKTGILIRNSLIALTVTIIWTGLTGDKAIATEELLIGLIGSIILTLVFYYLERKVKKQNQNLSEFDHISLLLLVSFISSVVFTEILVVHETEYLNLVFGFQKFNESLDIIRQFFDDLLNKDILTFACIVISLVLGLCILIHYLVFTSKSHRDQKSALNLVKKKIAMLSLISTGGSFVTVFVVCMNESWYVGDRYVINIFIIPLISLFPLIKYFLITNKIFSLSNKVRKYSHTMFVVLLIVVMTSKSTLASSILDKTLAGEIYTEYYPSEIQCLDQAVEKYNLKEGISGYWHAKWAYILSKHDITMAQYDYNHKPMTWITSDGWYRDTYDFALIITLQNYDPGFNLNRKSLIELNGEPEVVITCPVFDVLAYPTRKLKIEPIEPQNL